MSTIPRLITRYHHRVEFTFRNPTGVSQYRVSGHKTIDGAYAGPVNMFSIVVNTQFRSPTIAKNGWGIIDESQRGLSRALYDPNDYEPTSINLPNDDEMGYLRFEDEVGGAWQPYSPILVVPPANFFGTNSPSLTLAGNAPGIAAVAGEVPPALSLEIALPRTAAAMEIHNLNAPGGSQLLFSSGAGISMAPILPASSGTSYGPVNFLSLASSDGNPVPFTIICSMDRF